MKKAFLLYQFSNLLSLTVFGILIVLLLNLRSNEVLNTIYWPLFFIMLGFYGLRWYLKKKYPKAENPLFAIPICKLLQYVGVGSFLLVAILREFGIDWMNYGAVFSSVVVITGYILSFVLPAPILVTTSADIIDDIEFE